MMRKTLLILACSVAPVVVALVAPTTAFAAGFEPRTTGDLVELCGGGPGGPERAAAENFCDGFTQGVVQLDLHHQHAICFPASPPSRRDTIGQFVSWARGHEDRLSQPATEGFLAFMKERFPCH